MAESRRIDDATTTHDPSERAERARDDDDNDSPSPLLKKDRRSPAGTDGLPPKVRDQIEPAYSQDRTASAPSQTPPATREAMPLRREAMGVEGPAMLFGDSEVDDYRSRWSSIQTAFVDEPRQAVEDADNLVKFILKRLSDGFAGERDRLAKRWEGGTDVSTEDLRLALRRYHSFFDRLLNV